MSATGAAAPASATAVAAQPKPLIPTKQLSYEERLEALEQKKLEALIKVKESSLVSLCTTHAHSFVRSFVCSFIAAAFD